MLDQPSMIVLVDVWDRLINGEPTSDIGSVDIINFIENTPTVRTVVLASYGCLSELQTNNLWYTNAQKFFKNQLDYQNFLKYYNQEQSIGQHTHPALFNYVNPDVFQIAFRYPSELEIYLNSNQEIKNIYIAGAAWSTCVKDRPLGYRAIFDRFIKNADKNLLVCIDTVKELYGKNGNVHDTPGWKSVTERIFKYVGRINI